MAIRISMGHVDTYDARTAAFARQLGLRSVQMHAPSSLPAEAGYWRTEDLRALRERCENDGLAFEGLENVPVTHFEKIVRGGAGRDEQLENYCTTIRNMASAGINCSAITSCAHTCGARQWAHQVVVAPACRRSISPRSAREMPLLPTSSLLPRCRTRSTRARCGRTTSTSSTRCCQSPSRWVCGWRCTPMIRRPTSRSETRRGSFPPPPVWSVALNRRTAAQSGA